MAAQKKASPKGTPPAQQQPTGVVAEAPRVRMTIDGGSRGEEYSFHFEASAGGAVVCRLKSELSGRQFDDSVSRMESAELDDLLRSLDVTRLKQVRPSRMPPIPPCSLLGQLEVFDGKDRVQIVFMADAGQAQQAGYRLPAVVARAIEIIYNRAARYLGLEGAKAIQP